MSEREHEIGPAQAPLARANPAGAGPEGDDVEEHFEEMYERDTGFRAAWDELKNDPRHVFGEMVLRRRLERGLSQSALARSVGTSQNRIYLIENGEANPTLDTMLRLVAALGISFEMRPRERTNEPEIIAH